MVKIIMKKVFLCVGIIAVVATGSYGTESNRAFRLHFPKSKFILNKFEYIEEINIKVSCGHIISLLYIPNTWNVEIIREISAIEELKLSSGLGAARIKTIDDINDSIVIEPNETSCFAVEGDVVISGWTDKDTPVARWVNISPKEFSYLKTTTKHK